MADLPPNPDSLGNSNRGSEPESAPSAPAWVKVFGIIALVLVLVIIVMLLTGHGPGRHMQ